MAENSEEEKDNYSLLDQKRKEEIILQLKKEINEQIQINNSKAREENIDEIKKYDKGKIFKQTNEIDINKNIINDMTTNSDTNIIFNELNNFINNNNINNNKENKENKKSEENNHEKKHIYYLDEIKDKKNLLFNKDNNNQKIKSNNSFNIVKKEAKKYSKTNKNNKMVTKAKSTEKIKNNKFNRNIKSVRHAIISNSKSKEKFKKIKIEINNKFKEDCPFKPKINNTTKNIIKETKEEKYKRLSRPKIFEIKGKHMIKTEEEKLYTPKNINQIKSNKIINANEVSNRLYKLHQQIKDKKEQVKKIFEKKEMDKCSFNPEINNVSKKIMKKTNNNLSFNERNENYIKHKKESILKLREEIDKKINEQNLKKIKKDINKDEINVYDRLYENKYYSNMININLEKNDLDKELNQNNNKNNEINDFLERQKIYENIKKEHIYKFKLENNSKPKNGDEELTFKPKINSNSELIAKTNPERIDEDINDKYQRLYEEAEILKNKKEQLIEFYNAQYSFTPKINDISKLLGNNYLSLKSDIDINKITQEPDECTFKPKILNNEKYNSIESNYKFDENISKKIEEEILNRTNRINQLKSEYFYTNIKECKFTPEINKNIYNLKMYYTNNNNYYQKGLKKHLEQMEKAKKAKQEKDERVKKAFITGENWKNNKVCFKPFNLSKTNKSKNIEKIREEMKNEEMKECSFQPITNETISKNIVKKILDEEKIE